MWSITKYFAVMTSKRRLLTAAGLGVVVIAGILLYKFLWITNVQALVLADGSQVLLSRGSKLLPTKDFPNPRSVTAQGEILLRIHAGSVPFVIQSSQLILTVPGESTLVLVVNELGAQFEVLKGHVSSRRAYTSSYSDVEEVDAGQMVVMNREIDMVEHETTRDEDFPAWTQPYLSPAAADFK